MKFNPSPTPVEDAPGVWELADPKTTPHWSAVGYFFGKKIQAEVGGPGGAAGGLHRRHSDRDVDEAPTRWRAILTSPRARRRRRTSVWPSDDYATKFAAWQKQYQREDTPEDPAAYAAPEVVTSDWKTATLPGTFAASGLPDSGAFWIRKTVPVPGDPDILPNKGIDLYLGVIHDTNTVYWNGKKVGDSGLTATNHRYGIRNTFVQSPQGVLAVRIFSASPGAGVALGKAQNDCALREIIFCSRAIGR